MSKFPSRSRSVPWILAASLAAITYGSLSVAAPPSPGVSPGAASNRLPEHVVADVRRRLDYAHSLAERGAVLTARSEAADALRLIARTLDASQHSDQRARSLEKALSTLFDEKDRDPEILRNRYHEAAELLANAVDGQREAARALCTLGRLQTMPRAALDQDQRLTGPRAMALHLAAVRTDPQNTQAAHELGTLFAFYGQLDQAAFWLRRSTVNSTHPESWENLATVLDRQGNPTDANAARTRARDLQEVAGVADANGDPAVNWVDPASFARVGGPDTAAGPVELLSGQDSTADPQPAGTSEKSRSHWARRLIPGPRRN